MKRFFLLFALLVLCPVLALAADATADPSAWLTPEIFSAVVGIIGVVVSTFFGVKFAKYRKLLITVAAAYSDGKITDAEARGILADIKAIFGNGS